MALDPEQAARLRATKLRALVDEATAPDPARQPVAFPDGAALVGGDVAWVLVSDRPATSLGRVLAWADQQGVDALHVVVDEDADVLARRAAPFARPIQVHQVRGRQLVDVAPAPAPHPVAPSAEALALAWQLVEAGAEVVVEHGAVVGEVNGLEVARIVDDPDGGAPRIEVGVGRHDREAFAVLHGDRPTAEALADVVGTVRRHRTEGQPGHPLNRLAGERWLRRTLVEDPGCIGAAELEPVEPTVPRSSLQDVAAAVAVGRDLEGAPLVVACSAGIDLDLVPSAADARATHAPDARLLLVVAERDDHPVTRRLAGALHRPAEVACTDGPRALGT